MFLEIGRAKHVATFAGERIRQDGTPCLEVKHHRIVINDLNGFDGREQGLHLRADFEIVIQIPFDGVRVKHRTVRERYTLANVERVRQGILIIGIILQ